jgi:HD-GYP domain-containing protein (c-di-GMP phosphodiesterase class II)
VRILNKNGAINQIEYEMIKRHPLTGYELLKPVEFPWPVAEIVLQHHERLDGSGYPHGLTADEILPEAKVLAVADVVEAISSRRPYHEESTVSYALEEISKKKGILYDSSAVEACLRLFIEKNFTFL